MENKDTMKDENGEAASSSTENVESNNEVKDVQRTDINKEGASF